jgi:hypothetical protein
LKTLKLKNTAKTPEINFSSSGELQISGVSVPENSMGFYKTIIDWVEEYIKSPAEETTLIFKLTYINTSSLQFVYDILVLLDRINNSTSKVKIDWYYLEDDIDMREIGEDYNESVDIDFNFIGVDDV